MNRNPFIDYPEWVDVIWNVTTDAIAPQVPTNLNTSAIGESFVSVNWSPSSDSDVLGYKVYVNGNFYKNSKTNSAIIDRLSPSSAYNITVKAYDNSYNLSSDSNLVNVTTLASDNLAKDLLITKYIEGSSNNKALEITNLTNHEVDLKNYYLRIQLKGSTFYFSDPYELEGKLAAGESVVIINPNSTLSSYNVSQAKFVTNSPVLTFSGSQYIELTYGTKYLQNSNTNNYDMDFETVDSIGLPSVSNTNSNISLYRNSDVKNPNTSFTISEWTSYPSNYATGLGTYLDVETPKTSEININIFPNPTSNILYVQGNGLRAVSKAQIFDFSGKLIKEFENPFVVNNTLDVSYLKAGIYILRLDNKSINFIKK